MQTFGFWKMAGGGNDFIVVDGLSGPAPSLGEESVRRLCARGLSIGADGLIALAPSTNADFRMIHWNADGGANDYCGNGSRCAARLAVERGHATRKHRIETGAGVLGAEVFEDGRVRVEVPAVAAPPRTLLLSSPTTPSHAAWPGPVEGVFLQVGVPHLVVEVDEVAATDVAGLGSVLRSHPDLGAFGANVDFVQRLPDGSLAIRTFERGVEAETLSCGSGAVAAAVWLRERLGGDAPVLMRTRSGIDLTVRVERAGPDGRTFWLEGDARIIYAATTTAETVTETTR